MRIDQPFAFLIVGILLAGCVGAPNPSPAVPPSPPIEAGDESDAADPVREGPEIEAAPREPVDVSPI